MKEKSNFVADSACAQIRSEWNEVVVVHPDKIIPIQDWCKRFSKPIVDSSIGVAVLLGETCEIEPIMMDRP